jgi:hypothetical protein
MFINSVWQSNKLLIFFDLQTSQLRYDGLEEVAMKLTQDVRPKAPCPPSAHLFQQVNKARNTEGITNKTLQF